MGDQRAGAIILLFLFFLGSLTVYSVEADPVSPHDMFNSAAPFLGDASWQQKVNPQLLHTLQEDEQPIEFLIVLQEQANLEAGKSAQSKAEKGSYVYQVLNAVAKRTQSPLLTLLQQAGVEYRSFWIANVIWARGNAALLQSLARRSDVAYLTTNPAVRFSSPQDFSQEDQMFEAQSIAPESLQTRRGVEWNIDLVNADDLWAVGVNGAGAVIGGQDTGYAWQHPALKDKYRGWDGTAANHDYSWHDSIHSGGSPGCMPDSIAPCDDNGHGTHTMGTMVGSDGENQVGMAPGARWIGCRNMDRGVGTPTTYMECFQWFVAPTRLDGSEPRFDLAPDVINNSWGCPPQEGCDATAIAAMQSVVENVRKAGIVVVVSAGNDGSLGCGSVNDPPAIYDAAFSVGATTIADSLASFSSRGPAVYTGLAKPDISAPGSGVRSSTPGSYGFLSGTSMAGPHVAGAIALLISAYPTLRGQVDTLEYLLQQSARHQPDTTGCGAQGISPATWPNNSFGWGILDVFDAYQAVQSPSLFIRKTASAAQLSPGGVLTYTLTITHTAILTPSLSVVVQDRLPGESVFLSATDPYTLTDGMISWGRAISLTSPATLQVSVLLPMSIPLTVTEVVNQEYSAYSPVLKQMVYHLPVHTLITRRRQYFFPMIVY